MKSSLDILSALYRKLNVDELNNELTGKVYIGDIPDTSQLEDVSIKTLTNPNGYVQSGIINLNVYKLQNKGGRANLEKFDKLIKIIIPLVEDTRSDDNRYGENQDCFFQIAEDKGIFKDQDKDGMYFYNLRLEFQTI